LNHITDILDDSKEMAFLWSPGYIMFEVTHTQTWLRLNLGVGAYHITHENPNKYEDRNLEVRDAYDENENYEVIMNTDEGEY
jgi:hypothetical protein